MISLLNSTAFSIAILLLPTIIAAGVLLYRRIYRPPMARILAAETLAAETFGASTPGTGEPVPAAEARVSGLPAEPPLTRQEAV